MISGKHTQLSVRRQCELLCVNRSTLYYNEKPPPPDDIELLNKIREAWERLPFYGYRRITKELRASGNRVNKKRVQQLMSKAGIKAVRPGPNTSKRNHAHAIYPYLLGDIDIVRPNQAWMVDITYLRFGNGFMYLAALIDVHSRYIVGWSLYHRLNNKFSC